MIPGSTVSIAGFEPAPPNFERGIEHLKLLGAKYFIAYTEKTKVKADRTKELIKKKEAGHFTIYEFIETKMVEPVKNFEIRTKGKNWKEESLDWYKNSDLTTPIVFLQNENEKEALEKRDDSLETAQAKNIKEGDDYLEFETDKIGVPYIVKISYFPNWRVEGAKGPYMVSPSYMMVIPTKNKVRLYFAYNWADWLGFFLSLLGIGFLLYVSDFWLFKKFNLFKRGKNNHKKNK